MKNQITIHRRAYRHYRQIHTQHDFQERLFTYALDRYQTLVGVEEMGSVLALCANDTEAEFLARYPFANIVISGLGDQREKIAAVTRGDERVCYRQENAEALTYPARSFDLVFCKYGLHHLPRPVLGLYEMLRCCRKAAIFIEPYDSLGRRLLEAVRLTTLYERAMRNLDRRDNYVFPFERRQLETLLNSYYVDSGYRLELHPGWYSPRFTVRVSRVLSTVLSSVGWAMQYAPGASANLLTAIIEPGENLPRDPFPLGDGHSMHDLGI